MQGDPTNIVWIVAGGSAVLIIFALSFISAVLSSHRRVSEAQRARLEEVTKSAERYKALFDNSLAGMMKFSFVTWEVREANQALLTMIGCSSEAECGHRFSELPEALRTFIAHGLKNEGIVSEYEIQTKKADGTVLCLLFSAKVVGGENFAQAVIIDITERKMFEAKVKEQADLLDETQDAIIVTDDWGRIDFWNRGAERMYGWVSGEVSGASLEKLLYKEGRKKDYQKLLRDVLQYREWSGEHHHRRKDGKEILVESRWRIVEHRRNGRQTFLVVNTDITGKKRLETQYLKAQKMESIALLTGGIAHDLQNILVPVTMSIGLLREELKDRTSLSVLRAVEESAESGLQLVKNILTYGKGIVGERVTLELCGLLRRVFEIVRRGLPESVSIAEEFACEPCYVRGDMSQLKQVFLNICINARDAMPAGGLIMVSVEQCSMGKDDMEDFPEMHIGRYTLIRIRDTGIGIPDEHIEKIFEPFFTTKEGGEGTGLGLSIVLGIVRSHAGFIHVESLVNRGTTFAVYLPAVQSPAEPARP